MKKYLLGLFKALWALFWIRQCADCQVSMPRNQLITAWNRELCLKCEDTERRRYRKRRERFLLDEAVEEEKRRLLARQIAERQIARETYREN